MTQTDKSELLAVWLLFRLWVLPPAAAILLVVALS